MKVTLISQAQTPTSPARRKPAEDIPERTDPAKPRERESAGDAGAGIESGADTGTGTKSSINDNAEVKPLHPASGTETADATAEPEPETDEPGPADQTPSSTPPSLLPPPNLPGPPKEGISPSGDNRSLKLTPIRYREPAYPEEARRNGIEGTVEIRIAVDGRGRVENAEIIQSSGSVILDNEVLRTVRLWRFSRENAGMQSVHRIVFKLED
jgi:protein TonB